MLKSLIPILKAFVLFAIIIGTITALFVYAEPRTVYVPTEQGHWETVLPRD